MCFDYFFVWQRVKLRISSPNISCMLHEVHVEHIYFVLNIFLMRLIKVVNFNDTNNIKIYDFFFNFIIIIYKT